MIKRVFLLQIVITIIMVSDTIRLTHSHHANWAAIVQGQLLTDSDKGHTVLTF